MDVKQLFNNSLAKFVGLYFAAIFIWWLKINFSSNEIGTENYLFNLSYIVFNVTGGIAGIIIANRKWGGFASRIGKGLCFLSLGLLGQGFGLLIWTYYNVIAMVEIPYPSLADVGYFSLIPFYAFAMYNLAHASGAKFGLKSLTGKLSLVLIPLAVLVGCYFLFLSQVGYSAENPLKTILDIGYPTGEAISISLGLLTLSLSRGLLGGQMKRKIEILILALIFQFITEFTFLYTSGTGYYFNASFVDLMYAGSYFLMTLALLSFNNVEDK